jgi:hypothetical protein
MEEPTMLSASELAAKITDESGRLITAFTIYKWTRRGLMGRKLPHTRIGGLCYYSWDDYASWQAAVDALKDGKQPYRRRRAIA